MKQINSIIFFILTSSIPLASSQTRKAIPAGRYEALSGVKITHGQKNIETNVPKDSIGLFLFEVSKHIPEGQVENTYYSSGKFDANFKAFFSLRGVVESKTFNDRVSIFLSDNLGRDGSLLKKIKTKGSLIVLKEIHSIKDLLLNLDSYEIVAYQAEADNNYYLLKQK